MQFWLTAAVTLLLAGACSVNGLDAVLNDTCGAVEISQVACMIQKLDKKVDNIIKLLPQGGGQKARGSSCKEIFEKGSKLKNKAYLLNVDSKQIPVYCHMEAAELGACGGGGWTLVMKIDGYKETFHYDAKLWTNKKDHDPSSGKTLLDYYNQETKLPTYWSTPFTKICLAMGIDRQINSIVINKHANSLYSLIADGKHRSTSLGRHTWKKLIGQKASLQPYCNREGFNCHTPSHAKARIGIIANEQHDCISCDSRIGFGTNWLWRPHTCGNMAYNGADNGGRDLIAMGYILVQ